MRIAFRPRRREEEGSYSMVTAEAARTPAKGIETREPDVEKVPSFRALGLHAGARHRLAVSNIIIYFIIYFKRPTST